MHNIQVEQVIVSLFEQFADWNGGIATMNGSQLPKDVGMAFVLHTSVSNHGYECDGNTYHPEWEIHDRKSVHVIVLSRYRVYVAVTTERDLMKVPVEEFKNTSNHDSCWRSDGLNEIWQTIMKSYENCYSHVPEKHRKSPAQMSMYNNVGHGLSHQEVVKFVKVNRGDYLDGNYLDVLTSIVPLKMRVELIEE